MSTQSSLRTWTRLLQSLPGTKLAFIAGAGISAPSGLPTAPAFNTSLATFLAKTHKAREAISHLLITGYSRGSGTRVRFEQVMQILRSKDPGLEILRIFDETGAPTYLHRCLASAMSRGAAVFTTNFDSLIERAYYQKTHFRSTPLLYQVVYENENPDTKRRPGSSFEKYLRLGCPRPAVLKLHGSLRIIPTPDPIGLPRWGLDGLASIGATLDKLGSRSGDLQLEPNKEAALTALLHGRIVCIMGYSGADDFDITPSLAKAIEGAAGVIWIRHHLTRTRVVSGGSPKAKSFLPPELHRVCRNINTVVICGNTARIVQRLFRFHLAPDTQQRCNMRPVDAILYGHEPYATMDYSTRYLLTAMIAEEAADLPCARRLYNQVLAHSRSRYDKSNRAYALFRLGAIARTHGHISDALQYLRMAARDARQDRRTLGRVLNTTGVVYMDTGHFQMAHKYFRHAKEVSLGAVADGLDAAILTNLGLVERKQGHFKKALRYHSSALQLSKMSRNRRAMCRDYGNIGTVYLRLTNYAEALKAYTQATRFARIVGARDTLATVLMNQAIVLKHLSRFAKAERLAQEALQIEKALRRTEGIARYLSLMAGIAQEKREYSKAIKSLHKAIRIQQKLGRREGLADDWSALGDCLNGLHRLSAAKSAYDKSNRYFQTLGNKAAIRTNLEKIRQLAR